MFDEVTPDELAAICEKVDPNGAAPLFLADQGRHATWLEYMRHWRQRSQSLTTEAMALGPFLKREHAALLLRVEYSFFFTHLAAVRGPIRNTSLSWISKDIWKYFQLVLRLKEYGERELARRAGPF